MEKCAEQQRLLFLGMCSLEDRKRICDEKIMDLYNFERITYLLEAFGFEEYKFVFEMKYKDLLLKLADIVEQNLVCGNSMAGTGLISRLCGEVFGSALTFGAVGKASAPGQMNASDLREILTLIDKSI